jgi:hypothetical protein
LIIEEPFVVNAPRLTALAEGRDRSSGSLANVTFTANLEQTDAATQVHSIADVALRGRLAQFGTGVVSGAAELVRQFADRVDSSITLTVADETGRAASTGPSGSCDPPAVDRRHQAALTGSGFRRVVLVGLLRSMVARPRQVFARPPRRSEFGVRW